MRSKIEEEGKMNKSQQRGQGLTKEMATTHQVKLDTTTPGAIFEEI